MHTETTRVYLQIHTKIYSSPDHPCSYHLLFHPLENSASLHRLLDNLFEQISPLHQGRHGAPRDAVTAPGTSHKTIGHGALCLPEEIGAELGVVAVVLGAAAAEPAHVVVEAGLVGARLRLPAAGLEAEVGV